MSKFKVTIEISAPTKEKLFEEVNHVAWQITKAGIINDDHEDNGPDEKRVKSKYSVTGIPDKELC